MHVGRAARVLTLVVVFAFVGPAAVEARVVPVTPIEFESATSCL